MNVTAPPAVGTFQDLQDLQKRVSDVIIVAVDFETADHDYGEWPVMDKLSEAGCAYLDTRTLHHKLPEATPAELAQAIKVEHSLVKKLTWVTAETCPAKWHRKKPHAALPYHCQLARSVVVPSSTQLMDGLVRQIGAFESMNIASHKMGTPTKRSGDTELAERFSCCSIQDQDAHVHTSTPPHIHLDSHSRDVFVLFWDSTLEKQVFSAAGNSKYYLKPAFRFWDLQKFRPIAHRWNRLHGKSSAPCSEVAESLGVNGIKLHNGANDAYAEVLAFVRLLTMTEEQFNNWTVDSSYQLDPIDMSWLDTRILKDNQALGQREVQNWQARRRSQIGSGGRGGTRGGARGGHRGGRQRGQSGGQLFSGW